MTCNLPVFIQNTATASMHADTAPFAQRQLIPAKVEEAQDQEPGSESYAVLARGIQGHHTPARNRLD